LRRLGIDPSVDRSNYFRKAIYAHAVGGDIKSHEQTNDDRVRAYVVSKNIHRRHLTPEQKRDLIAKLIKATPEKSDRQIATTVKVSPTTVGTVRTKMEAKGVVSKLDTRKDTKGGRHPGGKQRQRERERAREEERAAAFAQAAREREERRRAFAEKVHRWAHTLSIEQARGLRDLLRDTDDGGVSLDEGL